MAERARNDSMFEGSPVADEFRIRPEQWSVFLQEIGTIADRDASPGVRGYDGHSFGFLAGIDRSMLGLDVLGLSAMVSLSDFDDDGFNDQDFEILTTQATLYGGLTFLGFQTYEFWSEFVTGTGVISTMPANEHYIVSNEIKMLPHLVRTYTQSEEHYRRLSDLPQFQALLASSLPDANALLWVAPRRLAPTLKELAQSWARQNAQLGVDWAARRVEEERRVLPRLFPNKRRDQLSDDEQAQLDVAVDEVLQNERARLREEAVPALMARKLREIEYLEAIEAGLLMLKLDPRALDLSVRVLVPLEEGT